MMTTFAAMLGAMPLAFGGRRGRGAAPAAGHRHRRRPAGEPGADALHDARGLSLSGPPPAVGRASPHGAWHQSTGRRNGRGRPVRRTARAFAAATLAVLSGCAVGPNYSRPDAPASGAFKELAGWKPATPMDDIDRGAWWSVYGDPVLDRLERETEVSNQNIRQAEAAYRQAAAEVRVARAEPVPGVGCQRRGAYQRQRLRQRRQLQLQRHRLERHHRRGAQLQQRRWRQHDPHQLHARGHARLGPRPVGPHPPPGGEQRRRGPGQRRRSRQRHALGPGGRGHRLLPAARRRRAAAFARCDGGGLRALACRSPRTSIG